MCPSRSKMPWLKRSLLSPMVVNIASYMYRTVPIPGHDLNSRTQGEHVVSFRPVWERAFELFFYLTQIYPINK